MSSISPEAINAVADTPYRGNEPEYLALKINSRRPSVETVIMPRPVINGEDYRRCLMEAAYFLQVLEDPRTGKQFEVTMANMESPDGPYDAEVSTYNSAVTTNPGNAVEFAEHAGLHNKRRLYLASPGNGFSSYFDTNERKYIRSTGRFIYLDTSDKPEDFRALPTIGALHRALRTADISIDRLSANSAGCGIATAMMNEMPENQISHAFFKSPTNVVDHHPLMLAYRMIIKENLKNSKKNKENTLDPWTLTDEMIADGRELLQRQIEHLEAAYPKIGKLAIAAKILTDGRGLAKGAPYECAPSPAAMDVQLAADKQPGAAITYYFPGDDELYRRKYHMIGGFINFLNFDSEEQRIEGLLVPGTHADHSYTPSLRWAAEKYAFDRGETY